MSTKYHVNPRIRAYGKARIDITYRARDEAEFQDLWRDSLYPFPFSWDSGWKFSFEYTVDDFAAEIGFFIDILGFPVLAVSPSYAQFITPGEEFCINISAVRENEDSSPPDSIRLQFRVRNIQQTIDTLESRGIVVEERSEAGMSDHTSYFRTPHGVCIELLGEKRPQQKQNVFDEDIDQDEQDADRIIEQLLGLTSDSLEDDTDEQENFFTQKDISDDEEAIEEDIISEDEQEQYFESDEENDFEPPANNNQSLSGRPQAGPALNGINKHPPQTGRYAAQPDNTPRNGSFKWNPNDSKLKNEPTYHTIPDESLPEEDS